jgi:hypothetical protein
MCVLVALVVLQDPTFHDQQALHDKKQFLNGAQMKRVEQQRAVYDPIKGTLTRAAAGKQAIMRSISPQPRQVGPKGRSKGDWRL